jgi:serine protease Do
MVRKLGRWASVLGVALALGWLLAAPSASAQQRERVAKEDAALVVDGVVRQVFRSPRQGRTDYLVQIDVQRSEGRRPPKGTARPQFPGPGDSVYVHVSQRPDAGVRLAGGADTTVPTERSQVRAYLVSREQGGWEGIYPEWFELTSDRPAAAGPGDPAPSAPEAPADRAPKANLGMTIEPLKVKDRLVLRVSSVERGGPAQKAGLEPGDVIIAARGAPLTGPEQLEELARGTDPIPIIVVDVHTGRTAQVELRPGTRTASSAVPGADDPKPAEEVKPAPAAPARSLGISAEPVPIGPRTALKVTRIEPGGAASNAGIEVGDILVAANGAAITGAEQLAAALRKSGPSMTLTVRDVRTGRDTPVEVALGGGKPFEPPAEAPAAPAGAGQGKLGVVTELAFYDTEAAVKVTEVEPGSPAARAGFQPGMLIIDANGKPVLHPNDLADAARKASGTLKLTVVDPRTGRKSNVNVNLGSGG